MILSYPKEPLKKKHLVRDQGSGFKPIPAVNVIESPQAGAEWKFMICMQDNKAVSVSATGPDIVYLMSCMPKLSEAEVCRRFVRFLRAVHGAQPSTGVMISAMPIIDDSCVCVRRPQPASACCLTFFAATAASVNSPSPLPSRTRLLASLRVECGVDDGQPAAGVTGSASARTAVVAAGGAASPSPPLLPPAGETFCFACSTPLPCCFRLRPAARQNTARQPHAVLPCSVCYCLDLARPGSIDPRKGLRPLQGSTRDPAVYQRLRIRVPSVFNVALDRGQGRTADLQRPGGD